MRSITETRLLRRLVLPALAVVALAATAPALGAAETGTPNDLGRRVEQRYEIRDLRDSILLRPLAEGSAVRSIEITDDGEVLVNGKEFTSREVESFLGEDGPAIRELAALGPRERRQALGIAVEGRHTPESTEDGLQLPPMPPVPSVPPVPRVRVRVSGDDRVSIGHSIELAEGEYAHDVVCVLCSADVLGEASGDVVAVLGSVHVGGHVGGSAAAILGNVVVEDGADVNGDGVAVGGRLETRGDAKIHGQHTEVGIAGPQLGGNWPRHHWGVPWGVFNDTGRLVAAMLRTAFLALLGVAAVLVARPAVDRLAWRAGSEPWKAVFAGLLAQLLFLPVLVLAIVILAVSIVGIPLLILVPFAILALCVGMLLGYVAVARNVGTWAERRFGWAASSVALSVVVGVVLIQSTSLVGRVVSIPGGWLAVLGFTILCVGFFLKYLVWTIGLGSVTLSAFSGEWRRANRIPGPTPPPPPGLAASGGELPPPPPEPPGAPSTEEVPPEEPDYPKL